MRNDIYRMLSLATACNLSCDRAYELLQQKSIDRFTAEYANPNYSSKYQDPESGGKLTIFDAYIKFACRECAGEGGIPEDVVYSLKSRRSEIIKLFLTESVSSMVTSLASRDTIKEMVRSYLRYENVSQAMYATINTSRVDVIFSRFLQMFEKNCAHAYQFDGTFQQFVMNCFINFFYKGQKKNIWEELRAVEIERRETEQAIIQEREVTAQKLDDLLIHDLLYHIHETNRLLFYHSGQSTDSHGIQYDIFYLMLCQLCRRKVAEINRLLGEDLLTFEDPYDRKAGKPMVATNGLKVTRVSAENLQPNKNIAAKITNATEFVTCIFDYVHSGKLNTTNIANLRDICFTLGKHDREGRNCIWRDATPGGLTAHYLESQDARVNFDYFDTIFRGVVSVHTLITEMEARGMSVIDMYNSELFMDPNIFRYMDYLSGVPYVDLIKQLQAEKVDTDRYGGDLFEFEAMVKAYAGSEGNHETDNRDRRYYAITCGFLQNTRLKQTSYLTDRHDILEKVVDVLDSFPRGCREYFMTQAAKLGQPFYVLSDYLALKSGDIIAGKYADVHFNSLALSSLDTTAYYICDAKSPEWAADASELMWDIELGNFEGILYAGRDGVPRYGIYCPLEQCFVFRDRKKVAKHFSLTLNQVIQSFVQGSAQIQLALEPIHWTEVMLCKLDPNGDDFDDGEGFPAQDNPAYGTLVAQLQQADDNLRQRAQVEGRKFSRAVTVPWDIGISNLNSLGINNTVDGLQFDGNIKRCLSDYISWVHEYSVLGNSLIETLKIMVSEILYLTCGSINVLGVMVKHGKGPETLEIPDTVQSNIQRAVELRECLATGEFTEDPLNWILDWMHQLDTQTVSVSHANGTRETNATRLRQVDWSQNTLDTRAVNTALLTAIYDDSQPNAKGKHPSTASWQDFPDLMQAMSQNVTPAERFVTAYNYICTKLEFLRLVRDSVSLVTNLVRLKIPTLVCELSTRFGVDTKLRTYKQAPVNHGIYLRGQSTGKVHDNITSIRERCLQHFDAMLSLFRGYMQDCQEDIAKLVDYNIVAQDVVSSRFTSLGQAFDVLPIYVGVPELDELRSRATVDVAGFFLLNGTYFKARNGNIAYYVHRSGHMARETNTGLEPVEFNMNKPDELNLYRSSVRRGLSSRE